MSSIYETQPWGRKDQPPFLNAVCSLYPEEDDPHAFLDELKRRERQAGRTAGERWDPRVLDIDLLFWGDLLLATEHLIVPHPRLSERRFVLEPLVEVAPDLICPGIGLTLRELLDKCPDTSKVLRCGQFVFPTIQPT